MNIDDIISKHEQLTRELKKAVSTMEKKDNIHQLYLELKDLQEQCPHYSVQHNFVQVDNKCPYCGKNLE